MSTVTTFDHKTTALTAIDTGAESRLRGPQEQGGRIRFARFSVDLPTGVADGDTIELLRMPGCTIVGGGVAWEDCDSGAGTANIGTDDGTTADPDALASALAIGTAGSAALPEAVAFTPVAVAKPFSIYATLTEGTALTEGANISGYVFYVENS